jgi:hypothetical protein
VVCRICSLLMVPVTACRVVAELQVVSSQAPSVVVERLCLSERQHRFESVLAYAIALEHVRIVGPSDARVTAAYAAAVLDNCRALAARTGSLLGVSAADSEGNPDEQAGIHEPALGGVRAYFSAVVRHIRWMRGLPVGYRLGLR